MINELKKYKYWMYKFKIIRMKSSDDRQVMPSLEDAIEKTENGQVESLRSHE
jgi:hypothetical protein